ncbi:MAG: DUF4434 domain-containing protein [bacterium]|nr:DUF4434 domain-containing protein [bacterium]
MLTLSGMAAFSGANHADSIRKPIEGSWFEFQHCWEWEARYWNDQLEAFSRDQWRAKVGEIAGAGLKYLVLLSVAQDDLSFYPSNVLPQWKMACDDPLEAVLSAGDEFGVKFFISGGFFKEKIGVLPGEDGTHQRERALVELAERYGDHASFFGWYWPNEAQLSPYFEEPLIEYINASSAFARTLKPECKIMIAPYGTRNERDEDSYARQLEALDVDIVAYQDEVGVRKTRADETAAIYEKLRRVHDKVAQRALWADVEIFEFEGEVYKSNLIAAPFDRVRTQLEAVSPFVDVILIYQYQGMMNRPGTSAFAGRADSVELYQRYMEYANALK